mmetsp:Transcript_1293/g.3944  ORF Transcript_1293/g.3944 Transcript_1293/m.3944 type:complete len:93 (-) Transcript_1293:363-641(-)
MRATPYDSAVFAACLHETKAQVSLGDLWDSHVIDLDVDVTVGVWFRGKLLGKGGKNQSVSPNKAAGTCKRSSLMRWNHLSPCNDSSTSAWVY